MYNFRLTEPLFNKIAELKKSFPSIQNKLNELSINPFTVAIPTKVPQIGEFYVNCGRHVIIIDIDQAKSVVTIWSILLSASLYRMQKGLFSPSILPSQST